MIHVRALDLDTGKVTDGHGTSDIDALCGSERHVVWVDVEAPTDADYAMLEEEFHFHHLAIEDCRHAHQRPKVDEYKGYYFVVLYEARTTARHHSLELRELNIFLGKNYLVTVHPQSVRAVETAARLWPEWSSDSDASSGILAYLLIDAIVDDYMPLLDGMSERMDELEEQIFGAFDPQSIRNIFLIKKQLVFLRRSIVPLRDVFNTLLRREQAIFARDTHVYFQDVFDHIIRVADLIDTLRDMIGSTMDAYLSISGNRMNVIMKRLTSISTILMSVTLIAGVYGMNFALMPELQWKYGYVYALGSMVVVSLVIYYLFRKNDWL